MAARTTWGPAPWLPKYSYLLKDGSVVQTPDLETTTSGQRVRIAGTTTSFGKGQLDEMLRAAVKEVATARSTEPWMRLHDDDEARRSYHGGASPGPGRAPEYSKKATLICKTDAAKRDDHTQITFEFESVECPSLTITVWVIINKYTYRNDNWQTLSGITYPVMHENYAHQGTPFQSYTGDSWYTPFSYYSHGPFVDESKEFLEGFKPIPDIDHWVNDTYTSSRFAVIEALKLVNAIRNMEYIDLPVWREPERVSTMKFKFKRSNLDAELYADMVEHIQVKPTLDRIKQNYEQIQRDLVSLGMVLGQKRNNAFLEVAEQAFAEDVVCHMIPMTEDGDVERTDESGRPVIVEDHAHSVSVDLLSGTIVVNCTQRSTEVLEQWNFERIKAELHGELDAFLGFARQKQQTRNRRVFRRIVKDRTPEDIVANIDDADL